MTKLRIYMTEITNEFSKSVLQSVLNYINEKSPRYIDMNELQAFSGYSKRHLNRLFTTHIGVRPSDYLSLIQMYRITLELKFTNASLGDICKKYQIKDENNLRVKLLKFTGQAVIDIKESSNLNIGNKLKSNEAGLSKEYVSCSFASFFNYNTNPCGVTYNLKRNINKIISSHYALIENINNDFCERYSIRRDEVWTFVKFKSSFDGCYEVAVTPCIFNNCSRLPKGETLSIQGDYLCFSWAGRLQDTFPKIKKIYDVFFLQHSLVRNDGYDIIHRETVSGVKEYYIYKYYIPIIINESVIDILN